MTFVSYSQITAHLSIQFMAWEVHQNGGRMPESVSGRPDVRTAVQAGGRTECAQCELHNAHFLAACAEAIEDAGKKADDQIWLSVFGALKQMLEYREGCYACRTKAASRQGAAMAARLNFGKHAGRKAADGR